MIFSVRATRTHAEVRSIQTGAPPMQNPTPATQPDPFAPGMETTVWAAQPVARGLVEELLAHFLDRCPDAARFGETLLADTGTHLADWIGVFLTPDTPRTRQRLEEAGFEPRATEFVDEDIHYAFEHRLGLFPDILLTDSDRMSVGVKVDSVADFFAATQYPGVEFIQGEPLARARWAKVFTGDRAAMWVMERHGYDGYHFAAEPAESRIAAMHHIERFRARPRGFADAAEGLADLNRSLAAAADELGPEWAADLFLRAERERFVLSHCAARSQSARQNALGLGWANTDHLVYAASAGAARATIATFGLLGFAPRESVPLAAADTAHVLEHPVANEAVVVVAPAASAPGLSGSWVALFGESLLGAGPAGLALRGDPELLVRQLGLQDTHASKVAVRPVCPERLAAAVAEGLVDERFAQAIRAGGALGSTLTAVSRRDGCRGFSPAAIAWRAPGG